MNKKNIFISHISKEAELAGILKGDIEKHFLGMFNIFVSSDQKTIFAGRNWLEEVDKALKKSDLLIVLCSEESVGRPWVNFESGAAWIKGIPVIPICHSGLKPEALPVPFSMLESLIGSSKIGLQKLYDAIASISQVNPPEIDFQAMADKVSVVEQRFIKKHRGIEIINNPRILCAATAQYMAPEIGFHLDVAVLQRTFPGCVEVHENLTRKRLLELLTDKKYDIVHLVMAVDQENGNLIFSEINHDTHKPVSTPIENMSPDGFASLLKESGTKLVVLATCKALLLAVEVARYANMAASDAIISGQQAEAWDDCFYSLLANGKNLYKAFDITKAQLPDIPIRAVRNRDIVFSFDSNTLPG